MSDGADRRVFGRDLRFTSTDRVVFPEIGLTKGDLLDHHEKIAPVLLRHLRERPLSLVRHPEGLDGDGFVQKQAPAHLPDWVRRVEAPKKGGTVTHVVAEEEATLLALVQFGVVEFHPWTSRADHLDRPDRIIVDLDPEEGDVDGARFSARAVREVAEEVGAVPYVMTSGSSGYHVVLSLAEPVTYEVARAFVDDLARVVQSRHPDRTTMEFRKVDRKGRVLLDVFRNAYGQTAVAAYSVRARPTAPIATPIEWDELGSVDPRDHTVATIHRRLGQRDDPWADLRPTDLDAARAELDALLDASEVERGEQA